MKYCQFCGAEFGWEFVRDAHERGCGQWHAMREVTDIIIDCASSVCGISREVLLSDIREMPMPAARMLVAWQLKRLGMSLNNIGRALGGRASATITHYLSSYEYTIKRNAYFSALETALEEELAERLAGTDVHMTLLDD